MLYLFLALALVVGVTIFLVKKGKIKDSDGDLIPDVVEDKFEDIKEDVKEKIDEVEDKVKLKVKQVKGDVKEHLDAIKEDLGEIIEEATSKPAPKKRGRKPATKRSGGSGKRVEKKPAPTHDIQDKTLKTK